MSGSTLLPLELVDRCIGSRIHIVSHTRTRMRTDAGKDGVGWWRCGARPCGWVRHGRRALAAGSGAAVAWRALALWLVGSVHGRRGRGRKLPVLGGKRRGFSVVRTRRPGFGGAWLGAGTRSEHGCALSVAGGVCCVRTGDEGR
jgi:hypothetical protein